MVFKKIQSLIAILGTAFLQRGPVQAYLQRPRILPCFPRRNRFIGGSRSIQQYHTQELRRDLRLPPARMGDPDSRGAAGGHAPLPPGQNDRELYQNIREQPFIHLLDGGIADNLGIRVLIDITTQEGGIWNRLQDLNLENTRKLVVVVVNAQKEVDTSFTKRDFSIPFLDTLSAISSTPLNRSPGTGHHSGKCPELQPLGDLCRRQAHSEPFRYFKTGSPFEYDLIRKLYLIKRQFQIDN